MADVPSIWWTSHASLLSFPCAHGQAGERPANPALWWVNGKGDEVKWSFEELGSLSRKAANVLTDPCGLKRGDRVAVILPRIPEWWLVNVACMRTGECQYLTFLFKKKFYLFILEKACTLVGVNRWGEERERRQNLKQTLHRAQNQTWAPLHNPVVMT